MKLEAAPIELQIEFSEQPDQTASLSDIAKRSDEIGIKEQMHTAVVMQERFHGNCESGTEDAPD